MYGRDTTPPASWGRIPFQKISETLTRDTTDPIPPSKSSNSLPKPSHPKNGIHDLRRSKGRNHDTNHHRHHPTISSSNVCLGNSPHLPSKTMLDRFQLTGENRPSSAPTSSNIK